MIQMIILWSLHSVQYSFQFAEEKSGVTFVCFYLNLGTFVRSFTNKNADCDTIGVLILLHPGFSDSPYCLGISDISHTITLLRPAWKRHSSGHFLIFSGFLLDFQAVIVCEMQHFIAVKKTGTPKINSFFPFPLALTL